MKRILILLFAFISTCYPVAAQNIEGQIIASQYGQWRVQGYAPDTYTFAPASCSVQGGPSFFPAFKAGTPILIVDGNPALSEIVTPSSVVINNTTCSISISPINHHNVPFYLTSASGGLQEAINANATNPGSNTILLNNDWYQLGGSAGVIAEVQGTANLGLIDITTVPSTWYRWNGLEYIVAPVGTAVSSVFGRTGAVVAETSDYNCSQITNCVPNAVPSVFGRTGAITAEAGDYTCLMVTGCPPSAGTSADFTLTVSQTDAATTASVNYAAGSPTVPGYFLADSEWEYYTTATSLGSNNYTLSGITRGEFYTTPASHNSGDDLSAMVLPLGPTSQPLFAFIGGEGSQSFLSISCPTGNTDNGGLVAEFGCPGVGTGFAASGGFTSWAQDYFTDAVAFGDVGYGDPASLDQNEPITHGSYVLQNDFPNSVTSAIAFPNGIPGGIKSIEAPTAPAPVIYDQLVPSGATTYTYICTGTDELGGNIPGTSASLTDLADTGWTDGALIQYQCIVPGSVTTSIYRTSGGPNQGLLATTSGAVLRGSDTNISASTETPSATNTSIPHVCLGGTQFCILYGTTETPPVSCSSVTAGWEYHNIAATASPYVLHCVSGASSWSTAY